MVKFYARHPNMHRTPLSIGLIGTSWWADSMYLPALAAHPRAAVAALCGRDRGRAERLAKRWDVARVYTDYRQMMRTGDLDAVVIASANDSHHPATMAALERGLHVLCEKPLALSVAEAAE
ncbi:MAG: Gfo/Idh/MocA family oxidoreductase, partial [Gammaproteobacteria bacterium]|nr:Gfo/Idh/MocA family oxidoreductase [Gammaproteobacteria bacterium]